jgi:hypothetical protein
MPVEQVTIDKAPRTKRTRVSKVSASLEWADIITLLPKLPPTDALVVSLSPETVSEFKNKDSKIALAAFRQKLRSEFTPQGFRVSVVGNQIVVKHKTEKPPRKSKGNK